MSMEISINVHVQEGPPLRFSGMDHGADCKSVVIGGDGYPDVTFFLNREHAIQIRDHFAALVEAWERSLGSGSVSTFWELPDEARRTITKIAARVSDSSPGGTDES